MIHIFLIFKSFTQNVCNKHIREVSCACYSESLIAETTKLFPIKFSIASLPQKCNVDSIPV